MTTYPQYLIVEVDNIKCVQNNEKKKKIRRKILKFIFQECFKNKLNILNTGIAPTTTPRNFLRCTIACYRYPSLSMRL